MNEIQELYKRTDDLMSLHELGATALENLMKALKTLRAQVEDQQRQIDGLQEFVKALTESN